LASANRDPAQFENPDALLLDRQPNHHVSFAHGVHFCLGANLARTTAAVAFTALLERFKALALVPDGRRRAPNPGLRGYSRMELTGHLRGVPR
jgi:cytochrome P450